MEPSGDHGPHDHDRATATGVERLVALDIRPYRRPVGGGMPLAERLGFEVVLADEAGRLGLGEVAPLAGFGSEALAEAEAALAAARRTLESERPPTPGNLGEVGPLLARTGLDRDRTPVAYAGLELCLLDLLARRAGRPLAELLLEWTGGSGSARPAGDLAGSFQRKVSVNTVLSGADAHRAAADARAALAEGYRTLKIKVGALEPREAVRRIGEIRQIVGSEVHLRVDAARAWAPDEARRALVDLAALEVEYVEEPAKDLGVLLGDPDRSGAEALAPIAADESACPSALAWRWLASPERPSVFVLKPLLFGGLLEARSFALAAMSAGARVVVTSAFEGPIGLAAAVHLAASLPGAPVACGLATGHLSCDGGFLPSWLAPVAGSLTLGDEPGLGLLLPPLERAASLWHDRPALAIDGVDRTDILTHAALADRVRTAASRLAAMHVTPGKLVGLLGENSLAWIVAHLALPLLGAASLPLNFRLADAELRWQLEASGAIGILSDPMRRQLGFEGVWPLSDLLDAPDDPGAAALERSAVASMRPGLVSAFEPGNPHTVIFTSGTTGKPKGVVLSAGQHLASARSLIAHLDLDLNDRWLLCMPVFHVGGLGIVHRMIACGGTVVVLERFDVERVAAAIARWHPTRISLTATMARRLLAAHPTVLAGMRTVLLGGETIGTDLLEACPQAIASYGLSEAGSTVAVAAPGESALHPLPGFEIRIAEGDRNCAPGEVGRVAIRGAALMQGYLGAPPLDGSWFETGDLGMPRPEGGFSILARREDLILSGGENVYPAEIEAALLDHPAVIAAAVAGIPDERWGQVPVAAIVLKEGIAGLPEATGSPAPDPTELEAFVEQRLARYKVPRQFRFLGSLPTRPSGKLDRRAVADLFSPIPDPCPDDRQPASRR